MKLGKFGFAKAMVALAALGSAASASAALITFTVTGTASGTGPSGSYSNQAFTATAVADTATKAGCVGAGGPIANCSYLLNSSVTVAVNGLGTYQLARPTLSVVNNGLNLFLLSEFVGSSPLSGRPLLILNSGPGGIPGFFTTYDLVSDRLGVGGGIPMPVFAAPTPTVGLAAGPIVTTSGEMLTITSSTSPTAGSGTFKALLNATTPSVPEPSTWAMMLAGFGMLGAALRGSKRASAALA